MLQVLTLEFQHQRLEVGCFKFLIGQLDIALLDTQLDVRERQIRKSLYHLVKGVQRLERQP